MMRKVKWGVLGTADIARGQTIPGMQLAEHCELYAIAGRKIEKAKAYQEEFGFQKAYGSYDELLVSEAQVKEMFRAAEENGVMLMEAFAYLHSPFVKAVKAELDAGVIGEIRYLESAFITGRRPDTDIRLRKETYGGALYDLGCYSISMAMWMLGKEPDDVRAIAQFSEKQIDLFTSALLLYNNGMVANLDCGMLLPTGRLDRFHIHGTLGEIVSPVEFNQCGEIPYTIIRNGVKETKTVTAPNNYSLESENLSLCILNGEKPHVSKEFSLLVARVTDRILREIGY